VRWDPRSKIYLAFVRKFVDENEGFGLPPDLDAPPSEYHSWSGQPNRFRAIALITSKGFENWSSQRWLVYKKGTPFEHLYTNAVNPCFLAPPNYVSFPMRYLPKRQVIDGWSRKGVCDAVFMSSRDGLHWDRRFLQGFLRPGFGPKNWTDRSQRVAAGAVQTGLGEVSLYYIAHYGTMIAVCSA